MEGKICFLWFLLAPCLLLSGQNNDFNESSDAINQKVVWHVKAMHPEGYTMDVKAFDSEGNRYDVKVLEDAEQKYIMDVKAFVGEDITCESFSERRSIQARSRYSGER